ncbi:hypothetical protein CYY_003420 [Polysphondylium violaceum]|uniref:Uncharacterized protein n=1 Tax=Polysphondylium violaceum TaxID=133409 RepID=A0A8J4PX21_9MYCE|nr:hypothetical protein CYY_003420 [Polysphondylium violaceum]
MQAIRNKFQKTSRQTKEGLGVHKEEQSVIKPETHSLRNESNIIKRDYHTLSLQSDKWIAALQDTQTKWDILASAITNFGDGLYTDNSNNRRIAEVQRAMQLLYFPLIKTAKLGIYDNASRISNYDIDQLNKIQHELDGSRLRADHHNHRLMKYKAKPNANPNKLRKREITYEKYQSEYDSLFRRYQELIRDLEFKSEDNLIHSRQLLLDLQKFFNDGYSLIHPAQKEINSLPLNERLISRMADNNIHLKQTSFQQAKQQMNSTSLLNKNMNTLNLSPDSDSDINNNNMNLNKNSGTISPMILNPSTSSIQKTTESTTVIEQKPATPKMEGSSSVQKTTTESTTVIEQKPIVQDKPMFKQDMKQVEDSDATTVTYQTIPAQIVEPEEMELKDTEPKSTIVAPKIIREYVYDPNVVERPVESQSVESKSTESKSVEKVVETTEFKEGQVVEKTVEKTIIE